MSIALVAGIIVVAIIVAIAISQRSGPRVTTIERKAERETKRKTEGDEP